MLRTDVGGVDSDEGRVHVRQQNVVAHDQAHFAPYEADHGRRAIDLESRPLVLRAHRAQQVAVRLAPQAAGYQDTPR